MRDVAAVLETLHHTRARPIDQTVRGGTQTSGYLFRLKQPILQLLEAADSRRDTFGSRNRARGSAKSVLGTPYRAARW